MQTSVILISKQMLSSNKIIIPWFNVGITLNNSLSVPLPA